MDKNIKDIWDQFSKALLKYINSKVTDSHIAEDLLQEVFIKVYKRIDQLEEIENIKAWLYRITDNTIIDYYRKHRETPAVLPDMASEPILDMEAESLKEEMSKCLEQLMFELPDKYQEALKLYDMEGMKHKELSQQLNLSLSGSKTRVQRARNRLKAVMEACCRFEFDSYGNIIEYSPKKECGCENSKCQK